MEGETQVGVGGEEAQAPISLSQLRHKEILRLAFLGCSRDQIAAKVGCVVETVSFVLASPLARVYLAELEKEAKDSLTNVALRARMGDGLEAAAVDALKINRAIMRNRRVDPRVRSNVAKHFLDRIVFEKSGDEKDGSYREILRGLDKIQKALGEGAVLVMPPDGEGDGADGAGGHKSNGSDTTAV